MLSSTNCHILQWKEKLDTIIQKNIREEYDGLKDTKDWFTLNFDLVQREVRHY